MTSGKMFLFVQYILVFWFTAVDNTYFNKLQNIKSKPFNKEEACSQKSVLMPRYIIYDVNQYEGFNLRRDVYMRMAMLLHNLRYSESDWHLVLPPWDNLRHWTSPEYETGPQKQIPWALFFDITTLKKFAPVLELSEYVSMTPSIDNVFILQHYKKFFNGNSEWKEKWSIESCHNDNSKRFSKLKDGTFKINAWNYDNITAIDVKCISFQGTTNLMKAIVNNFNTRSIFIDHAEVIVHEHFGDATYWKCRRSMKFSKELQKVSLEFIYEHLDPNYSTEEIDEFLKSESKNRNTNGGSYIAVHLRRKDFLVSHLEHVPSIKHAAKQIKSKLSNFKLEKVFIATDGTEKEVEYLINILKPYKAITYKPTYAIKRKFKDGGLAIIDQIICSYANVFIGTHESTFTFRIQEEREIYGFPLNSTFNTFCPDVKSKSKSKAASQPTRPPKKKEEISQDEAAIIIQSQFRGFQARKQMGPVYGQMDETTKIFIKHYCRKWKKSSLFHVLLLYRAAKYQELVYFSQQAHLYNQNAVSAMLNNNKDKVALKSVDQRVKASQFLGDYKPAVWKLPFRIKEFPFCETHLDPTTRVPLADDISWDDPFKYNPPTDHYGYVMRRNEKKQIYVREEDNNDVINFIQTPYCRDPNIAERIYEGQPYRKYDSSKKVQRKSLKNKRAPTPQEFAVNTGVNVRQQASNLKDVNPAKTFNPQVNNFRGNNVTERNSNHYANNNDIRPKQYGQKRDHNPIIEMEMKYRNNDGSEDDPPFNFQAMLRKTNVNRASLRRSPEPADYNRNDSHQSQQDKQDRMYGGYSNNNNYRDNVVYNSGNSSYSRQQSYNDERQQGYSRHTSNTPTMSQDRYRNSTPEETHRNTRVHATVQTEILPGFIVRGQVAEL